MNSPVLNKLLVILYLFQSDTQINFSARKKSFWKRLLNTFFSPFVKQKKSKWCDLVQDHTFTCISAKFTVACSCKENVSCCRARVKKPPCSTAGAFLESNLTAGTEGFKKCSNFLTKELCLWEPIPRR
jgi:hypothetical protein